MTTTHPTLTVAGVERPVNADGLVSVTADGSGPYLLPSTVAGILAATKQCLGCDQMLAPSDPDLCETCELHADAGPFRVESWNERP